MNLPLLDAQHPRRSKNFINPLLLPPHCDCLRTEVSYVPMSAPMGKRLTSRKRLPPLMSDRAQQIHLRHQTDSYVTKNLSAMLSLAPSTFMGLEGVWQEFPGVLEIFLENTNFEILLFMVFQVCMLVREELFFSTQHRTSLSLEKV